MVAGPVRHEGREAMVAYVVVRLVKADGAACWEELTSTPDRGEGERSLQEHAAQRQGRERFILREEPLWDDPKGPFVGVLDG